MGNLNVVRVGLVGLGVFAILGCRTDVVGLVKAGTDEDTATDEASGSETGSDWTSSGDDCAPGPPGVGPCPAECSGGCEDGACMIRCEGLAQCVGEEVVCPVDWPCIVQCIDEGSCENTEVRCGDRGCDLICNASWSCDHTTVLCGEGPCSGLCLEGGGALHQQCGSACRCILRC